ncbi:hypothetical protein A6A27_09680 [Micromonospora sp. CB01531]|nr:hypothetical protein A6A27_09680 [Micromonospora sp. CB01531]
MTCAEVADTDQFGRWGDVDAGTNQLRAFINQSTAFERARSLPTKQARPVIGYAERMIRDADQQAGQ